MNPPGSVSIAVASEESGIGIETLRQWERRYGKPVPLRLPSGHRRYTAEQVRWLRSVAEALARGHSPSAVVRRSEAELDEILGRERARVPGQIDAYLLERLGRFDEREIVRGLKRDAEHLGVAGFISGRLAPLLEAVGRAWRDGELEVAHEHFLSEILEGFLREMRGRIRLRKDSPVAVLATLSGELHGLGLHMAALLFAEWGVRPHMFGTDTPNEEIVRSAADSKADAVAVSVSLATRGVGTEHQLRALREALPDRVVLVAGGKGAKRLRRGVKNVEYFARIEELSAWLAARPLHGQRKARP